MSGGGKLDGMRWSMELNMSRCCSLDPMGKNNINLEEQLLSFPLQSNKVIHFPFNTVTITYETYAVIPLV